MAYNIKPAQLIRPESHFVIGTPIPAEGTRVPLINGFPSTGGRDMGEMESAPKAKKLGSYQEIKVVNSATAIDGYITDPGAELSVVANRYVAENVRLGWNSEIRMMADGSAQVGIGMNTELENQSVLCAFQSSSGSGQWFYIMLYDAIMTAEVEVEISPDKIVGMQYTFRARPVAGRSTNFALGEHNLPAAFI